MTHSKIKKFQQIHIKSRVGYVCLYIIRVLGAQEKFEGLLCPTTSLFIIMYQKEPSHKIPSKSLIFKIKYFFTSLLTLMDGRKLHVVDLSLSFRFDDVVHLEDQNQTFESLKRVLGQKYEK